MKSHKSYLLILFLVFSVQVVFLSFASESQSGAHIDRMEIQNLQRRTGKLEAQLSQTKRDLAIAENKFITEQGHKQKEESKREVASVRPQRLLVKSESQAQELYGKIDSLCDKNLSSACLQEIDNIVTAYPGSKWSAKSLLLLSHLYFMQNKKDEAKRLIHIVKQEFKSYDEFNSDIVKLSKRKM